MSAPKTARAKIVDAAISYEGSPYLYGGIDSEGFDCSGLVFRVYLQTLGISLPRTTLEQYYFREAITRAMLQPGDLIFFNTTGPIAHVGIYKGEDKFIHAASDGPSRGVIESSLTENYWARAFAGAGRIIPPAEYLGLIFSASLGPSFGAEPLLRGARGSIDVAYRFFGIEAGLGLRPEYDNTLGAFRLPLVLSIAVDKRLSVFAGPALTLGSPSLGANRPYQASGGILATAGIDYTLFRFRVAGLDMGVRGELVYNRYTVASGLPGDLAKDLAATVDAGLGLSLRWGM